MNLISSVEPSFKPLTLNFKLSQKVPKIECFVELNQMVE